MHEFNVLCRWKTDYSKCPENCQIRGEPISETGDHGLEAYLDEQIIGGHWRGLWLCINCEWHYGFCPKGCTSLVTHVERCLK